MELASLPLVVPAVPRLASPLVKPCGTAGKRSGEQGKGVTSSKVGSLHYHAAPRDFKCSLSPSALVVKSHLPVLGKDENEEEEEIPKHVSIIMDGNGRWAQKRGLRVQDGHLKGIINLKHLTTISSNLRIKLLSVYAFSSQNWTRSHIEVEFLMRVFQDFILSTVPQLMIQHNLRFSAIGNKSRLPKYLQSAICSAEEMSKGNKGLHLVMALSYGGRDDILDATRKIATKVEKGILRATEVDEAMLSQEMMTSNLEFPDPDLVIRTSGELRISNFFLWQSAYTEFYFTPKLFPDFGFDDLREAIASYRSRKRSYGQRS